MATSSDDQGGALVAALAKLAKLGVIPRLGASLEKGTAKVARQLREAVVSQISAFTASGNPDVLPDLDRHAGEHIEEFHRLLAGGKVGDFEFVRAHARRRAGQRFPLEAMLHAYRCAHKVLSHWIREAALATKAAKREQVLVALADFSMAYIDAITIAAAGEYVAQTRILAETEGDRRTELLSILVSGYDEADGRVARLLKRAGYLEQRRSFCVALAQSTDPLEMENPARVQRIVEAMTQTVAPTQVRVLVGLRDNVVTAVFSDVRRAAGMKQRWHSISRR